MSKRKVKKTTYQKLSFLESDRQPNSATNDIDLTKKCFVCDDPITLKDWCNPENIVISHQAHWMGKGTTYAHSRCVYSIRP